MKKKQRQREAALLGLIDRLCDKLGEAIDSVDTGDVKALKELTATVHELRKIQEVKPERDKEESGEVFGVVMMPPTREEVKEDQFEA